MSNTIVCSYCRSGLCVCLCVCVVQPTVLVSNILLEVASRLRFELLAVGGTLERTEGRGAEGGTHSSKETETESR